MALGYTLSDAASTVTIPIRTSLSKYAGLSREMVTKGRSSLGERTRLRALKNPAVFSMGVAVFALRAAAAAANSYRELERLGADWGALRGGGRALMVLFVIEREKRERMCVCKRVAE